MDIRCDNEGWTWKKKESCLNNISNTEKYRGRGCVVVRPAQLRIIENGEEKILNVMTKKYNDDDTSSIRNEVKNLTDKKCAKSFPTFWGENAKENTIAIDAVDRDKYTPLFNLEKMNTPEKEKKLKDILMQGMRNMGDCPIADR